MKLKKAVIWGFRTEGHTHRYIHQGFATAFERLGWEVAWVDDLEENNSIITDNSLVLTVDVASKKLLPNPRAHFVLHNVIRQELLEQENAIRLQVFTKAATGESIHGTTCLWDEETKTIYQPWGIPSTPDSWLSPQPPGTREFWVGSIWNNPLGQGNSEAIADYKRSLHRYGIKFQPQGGAGVTLPRLLGGKTLMKRSQLSEAEAQQRVAASPVGAAIVGDWQRDVGYAPCRLFKNLGAGQPVVSNGDFDSIFHGNSITSIEIDELVDRRLALSLGERRKLVSSAQNQMREFTYEAGINRIMQVIR